MNSVVAIIRREDEKLPTAPGLSEVDIKHKMA